MPRALLIAMMTATVLGTAHLKSSAACPDPEKLSANQKLEMLETPLDRNDRAAVACTVAFMDDLSRRRDFKVMGVLIQNLDLELTTAEILSELSPGLHVYGGKYPAMDDISWFGKDALPPLLDEIAKGTPETLLTQNAIKIFMSLQAHDPPSGIKLMVQRAAKEEGRASQNLTDAARFATSLWQCRHMVQACQDALKNAK